MIESDEPAWATLVDGFDGHEKLRDRLIHVLKQLPAEVIDDFRSDPRFVISSLASGKGTKPTLWMPLPSADGSGSRCVVLKQRLASCAEPFGLWVIAHELAHAYLRNGNWRDLNDIEESADALAAHWGFPRPESKW